MENKLFRVNNFKIVGKLVSADVKKGFDKSGKSYVSTNAVIQNEVDGKLNTFEVNFYSGEMTRDNKVSQLYTKYVSLPELINKKVEVTGELKENRYWSSNLGQIVGSQQLSGRFVNGVLDRKKVGNIIRSEQVSNDMYVSIDLVEETLERQLIKYRTKIVSKKIKKTKSDSLITFNEFPGNEPFTFDIEGWTFKSAKVVKNSDTSNEENDETNAINDERW